MKPYPFYTAKAKGSKLIDVDGNEYIDFWLGHFVHVLGHNPPPIMNAVRKQLQRGTHYGTCHELEIALAEQVVKMVPSAEMVRFTNSGTEAFIYATRLARTQTKRNKIGKFEGGWHGGYDALHLAVKPPFDIPESGGLTPGTIKDTVVLPFNNLEGTRKILKRQRLAAIIVEPVLGAGGCIPCEIDFLEGLRALCIEYGTLLIFDEVITGFRLAPGGAQQFFKVEPDITVLGKILGGGFPIGAIASSKEVMQLMNPLIYERPKFSFHGGTFCANPISMTAGLAMLKILEDGSIIARLNKLGDYIRDQLRDIFERRNLNVRITGLSSIWHTHFTSEEVKDCNATARADTEKLAEYHSYLVDNGVFLLQTRMAALSDAHTQEDIAKLLNETENYVKASNP